MREAGASARSYTSCRDSEIKLVAYTCLLHWPSFQHLIASAPAAQVVFYCSIYDLSSWHRCPNLNFNHKVVEKKNDIMQRNTSLALYLASMSSAIQYPKSLHGSQVCLPLHYQGFATDASKCCI